MSYFTGKNLERKINEFGLRPLDDALEAYANGQGWIGDQGIGTTADYLETLRIVTYSMLHKYGVKEDFTVKMSVPRAVIELRLKTSPRIGQQVDLHKLDSGGRTAAMPTAGETSFDPGFKKRIFNDSDTLD